MSGLVWNQTVCHTDVIPEIIFQKYEFEKKSNDDKRMKKIPNMQIVKYNSCKVNLGLIVGD